MIAVSVIGIFMAVLFILINTFVLSVSSSGSADTHPPRRFCPWAFSFDIGLNMLPSESLCSV